VWWILQRVYAGGSNVPVPVIHDDRNSAAKTAIANLVNSVNVDGQPDKVKFGLARYDGVNSNGGYVVATPAIGNKATLLATLANLPASGSTPLSETLVDVGRYFAGADRLGAYPAYNRDLTGGTGGTVPGSPILNSCEKNFVIVITDGLPTDDCQNHYGTNFSTTIGDFDHNPTGDNPTGQCPTGTGATGWLDDVAKYLHDNDLRRTMIGVQNLYVYTVGFGGVTGTLLQSAADEGGGRYYQNTNAVALGDALESAIDEIIERNTSLTSATVPSSRTAFGDGFYTAYFLPGGRKGYWHGHLEAYRFSPSLIVLDATGAPAIDPVTDSFFEPRHPFWDAEQTILAAVGSRQLYTTKAGARTDFTTANMTVADLGLTLAEKTQFPYNDPNLITDPNTIRSDVVNFVQGFDSFDEDRDGDPNEVRDWVMGEVFHSNPVAVGPPLPYLSFEEGYGPNTDPNSFIGRYGHRDRKLYVGANDGMLHAFSAGSFADPNTNVTGDEYYTEGDGTETFGYIPGFELGNVKQLPKNDIGKLYFVDGTPAAADAWIDSNSDHVKQGNEWTTTLIGTMRQGGEGLLALDVTDPNALTAPHGPYPRLMWEFTHSGLGQTWSRPIITRVKMRASSGVGDKCGDSDGDGDCEERWVAIFGAGYRPEGDPNLTNYTNDPNNAAYTEKGRGVYILDIESGTVLARLRQIRTDLTFQKMQYAITAEPAVLDTNFDGFADVIYIGDTGGQLWKWDISKVGVTTAGVVPTSVWPAGIIFSSPPVTVAGGRLHYHSIFQGAAAAYVDGKLTLSFASGERTDMGYVGESDPNNPASLIGKYDDNNRFWVMRDLTPTGTGAFPTNLPVLEQTTIPGGPVTTGHDTLTDITNLPNDPNTADAGYYFRVPDGEKFTTNHLIFAGVVATLSYLPAQDDGSQDGSCSISGQTNQWAWDLKSGGGFFTSPDDNTQAVRTLALGNGAPSDPRLTVSRDEHGNMVVKVTTQTSTGGIPPSDVTGLSFDPVELIFWRQSF
jgi:type IV pilus assembly protein PilY1